MAERKDGAVALAAGGLAGIAASVCCLGPLVLVSAGLGGAWMSNLAALEPFRPVFVGAALVALFFAYRRIWRPAAECKPGEVCAVPETKRAYKIVFSAVTVLVLVAISVPYAASLFY